MIPIRRIERIDDRTIRVVPESGPYFEAELVCEEGRLTLADATFLSRRAAIMIAGPSMDSLAFFEAQEGVTLCPYPRNFRVSLVDDGPSTRWAEEAPTPEPARAKVPSRSFNDWEAGLVKLLGQPAWPGTYVLLADGTVRLPADLGEWSRQQMDGTRVLEETTVEGASVSTVFLGSDHDFTADRRFPGQDPPPGYQPLIFETMVFGGPEDDYKRRYRCIKEARAAHSAIVAWARAGYPEGGEPGR